MATQPEPASHATRSDRRRSATRSHEWSAGRFSECGQGARATRFYAPRPAYYRSAPTTDLTLGLDHRWRGTATAELDPWSLDDDVSVRTRYTWDCHWGVRTKSRTPLAQKGGPKVAPRVVPRCSGEATSTPDRGTAAPAAELCPQRSGTGLLSLTSPFPGCACQLTLGAARSWRIPPGRSRCAAPRQDPSQRWR